MFPAAQTGAHSQLPPHLSICPAKPPTLPTSMERLSPEKQTGSRRSVNDAEVSSILQRDAQVQASACPARSLGCQPDVGLADMPLSPQMPRCFPPKSLLHEYTQPPDVRRGRGAYPPCARLVIALAAASRSANQDLNQLPIDMILLWLEGLGVVSPRHPLPHSSLNAAC